MQAGLKARATRAALKGCATLLLVASVSADDWPQWRGPAGTGVSTDGSVPLQWSEKDGIAWRAPLGGAGVSTPVVWGNRVFVTSQAGAGVRREGNHPTLMQGGGAREAGERPLHPGSAAPKP